MFGRYLQKTKRFWHAISPHSCLNLFRNMCERSWRQIQPIARKMDLTGMYRGALDSGLKTFRSTFNLQTNQRIIFLKNLSSGLKIIRQFVKVDRNVYKTANKSASIQTNQIHLSCNRPGAPESAESIPMIFHTCF